MSLITDGVEDHFQSVRNSKISLYGQRPYSGDATSTYIIERDGVKVTAFHHDRNEVPNTVTPKLADNIRNALVAAGAMVSLSEVQWSALSKGFLADEIGG